MGTQNTGLSAEANALAAQHGIPIGMAGGYNGDPNDRELIWDRETRAPVGTRDIGAGGGPGEFTMQEQAEALYGGSTGATRNFPVIFTESKAEHHIYNRPDEREVTELQRRLWAGGFYPPGTQMEDITPGLPDTHTAKAWQTLLDRSANYYASGKQMTVWEVLDEGANIGGPGAGGRGGDGGAPLVTELTNPEDLRYVAQRVAVSTLGRPLRDDEINRFVSSFHGSQQSAQAQAYNLGGGAGGTVVGAPDASSAAAAFAQQAAPVEASAHGAVKVFDVLSGLLGGRRGGR